MKRTLEDARSLERSLRPDGTPPRTDLVISLEPSKGINPIHQLREKPYIFGGTGGRDGRTLGKLFANASHLSDKIADYPVSQARQEMAQQHRSSIIDGLLSGPPLTGFGVRLTMNPEFQDALVHELRFGKMERHPRKAFKSFKRASKAMVRQFRKEVKHG